MSRIEELREALERATTSGAYTLDDLDLVKRSLPALLAAVAAARALRGKAVGVAYPEYLALDSALSALDGEGV
jgi:hypothetical protein